MKIPKQHDFPGTLIKEVLENTRCSVPSWEISVQRKDDVAWSVVLSFLISADFKNKDDFARRLEALTGSTEKKNLVKRVIRNFNPFRNRYSCFHNDDLKEVIAKFQCNLNWDNLQSVPEKLSAASKRLGCTILLILEDKGAVRCQIYSEIAEEKSSMIALHSIDYTNVENKITGKEYNFLLDNDLGIRLKFASLRYFLKEAKIPRFRKNSKKVESAVKKGEHFLISLLKSDCQEVISALYDSAYLVSKLKEAGFETDPSSKDSNGYSALHHALVQGKIEILYKLYYFSANNCCQMYRDPDSGVVSNLQMLKEVLSDDFAKFEATNQNYNERRKEYDSLLRFNKFLTELSAEILKIKSKLNYYERNPEIIFEASKRRDVILHVLDTYIKYFKVVPLDSAVESPLDDYLQYINYYNSIDVVTAKVFFSNIISLKERLVLSCDNHYSKMEISFFLNILFYHCLGYDIPSEDLKDISAKVYSQFNYFYIPLNRRIDNMKKIAVFHKILSDIVITKDNVTKLIPEDEILSIYNYFPIFKNIMHLCRLQNYIHTALKIKVVDEKSALVIQRALQVIGEYVHTDNNNDKSFRRFLMLTLPKEVCCALRRVRHELSHLKCNVCKFKFDSEKNVSLFRSIQKEIGSINRHFSFVYNFYKWYEMSQFFKMLEGEIEEVKKLKQSCGSPGQYSPAIEEMENDLFINLKRRNFLTSGKRNKLYRDMFEITLHRTEIGIEEEIKRNEENEDREQLKNKILYILWPLKHLIELLLENDRSSNVKLLEAAKTMYTCVENADSLDDLKIKANKFITKCRKVYFCYKYKSSKKRTTALKTIDISFIEHFLKILRGFTYLSDEQKEDIKKEIPEKVKLDNTTIEELKESVHKGFTLNIDESHSKFQILCISKKKLRKIFDLYKEKNRNVLSELETIDDPISELEKVFSNNSVNKKRFERLCEIMQFSDKAKRLLENLVAGQRKKIPENKLQNLLNRIESLKKFLIEENEEIRNLWLKIKRSSSKKHVFDRIIWYYMRDSSLQACVEMLFLDCTSIFKSQTGMENPWIKTSNLYCGINLRNIMSHGNPFLDSLCTLLAPDDLASEMIQKMLELIEDEDAVKAILELYKRLDEDYSLFHKVINIKDEDEYSELRDRILGFDNWKSYSLLLPYKPTRSESV